MITTYFKNLVANNVWHTKESVAMPDTYWLALSSTSPSEDGTGVDEPEATAGYSRVQVPILTAASEGSVTNETIIAWPRMASSDGTVEYWAMFDAEVGGNLLMGGALNGLKHLDAGTSIIVESNGLTFNILGA